MDVGFDNPVFAMIEMEYSEVCMYVCKSLQVYSNANAYLNVCKYVCSSENVSLKKIICMYVYM